MKEKNKIDRSYIFNIVQSILLKSHVNKHKQKIKEKNDRLTFACPICGDSASDPHKKRGHLFFKNLYYKCYNEGCDCTFTTLCKKFDINLDIETQERIKQYVNVQIELYNKQNNEWFMSNFDKLIPKDVFFDWMNNNINSPFKSLSKITFGSSVFQYLKIRGFSEEQINEYFYQGTKMTPWNKVEAYIIFLNIKDDKIIGMQERNLRSGQYRRFKIWTFEELYNEIYDTELDMMEAIGYNKLSYLFNIFNVQFDNIVTIFEGYIDSLFYPNSIGAVGVNTDFNLFKENDIDIQFFFDNDYSGKKKSYEYLKNGYKVFIWENLINDLSKKQINQYEYIKWFNNNIKDLNDLMVKTSVKWYDLKDYFSNELVQIMNINYNKPKKTNNINIHNFEWKL